MDQFVKIIPFRDLSPRLAEGLPLCEHVACVRLSLGQEILHNQHAIRAEPNGEILKIIINDKVLYRTINKQIVVFKMVLSGYGYVLLIDCGSLRGDKVFNYKLRKWFSRVADDGYNLIAPDLAYSRVVQDMYQKAGHMACTSDYHHLEIDYEREVVRDFEIYDCCSMCLFVYMLPCCLCSAPLCIGRYCGHSNPIEHKEMLVDRGFGSDLRLHYCTDTTDPDLTIQGAFPAFVAQAPVQRDPASWGEYQPRAGMCCNSKSGASSGPAPGVVTVTQSPMRR